MIEPITGVQLYTLRSHTQTEPELDATLARLSAWGVRDVQFSAIGADITPAQQKALLEKYDMRVCITHQNYARLCDFLPEVIEAHKIIGCDSVGLGWTPEECRTNLAVARDYVKNLGKIAETLHENGLHFSYHNHDFEFKPLSGGNETLMDLFLNETDPQTFSFIPDVAWIQVAGLDPAQFLRKLSGRVKVVHFKDYVPKADGRPQFVSLGQGVVDLPACFDVCRALEFPYVMYEQDDSWTNDDPFEATKESLACFERLHQK